MASLYPHRIRTSSAWLRTQFWHRLSFANLIEIGLWSFCAILLLVGFLRVAPLLLHVPDQTDFAIYRQAGLAVHADQPVYVLTNHQYVGGFLYPPIIAVAFRPLATLPENTAHTLWYSCNLGMLAVCMWLTTRLLAKQPRWMRWSIGGALCLWPAVYDTLAFGQINLLLYALLVGTVLGLRKETPRTAVLVGLLLGIAITIKLFLLILLPILFLHRRHSVWLSSIGVWFILMVLGGSIVGWSTTRSYLVDVLPHVSEEIITNPTNQSVQAVLGRLLTVNQFRFGVVKPGQFATVTTAPILRAPQWVVPLAHGAILCIMLLTYGCVWRRPQTLEDDLGFAVLALLLVVPIVWDYYYVFALLPLLCSCEYMIRGKQGPRMLLAGALMFMVAQRYWRYVTLLAVSPLLMLFGCLGIGLFWTLTLKQRFSFVQIRTKEGVVDATSRVPHLSRQSI